ncbi:MAG: hypothetical protein H7A33_07515 [Deltaproteobacteria bacterium]|nr:hypothetical protein [Deltaproteobacteria bacterium]
MDKFEQASGYGQSDVEEDNASRTLNDQSHKTTEFENYLFEVDLASMELFDTEDEFLIDEIVQYVLNEGITGLTVVGYADDQGVAEENMLYAQERADIGCHLFREKYVEQGGDLDAFELHVDLDTEASDEMRGFGFRF